LGGVATKLIEKNITIPSGISIEILAFSPIIRPRIIASTSNTSVLSKIFLRSMMLPKTFYL